MMSRSLSLTVPKNTRDGAARRLTLRNQERSKDSRVSDPVDPTLADQLTVQSDVEIPHRAVRLEDGMLASDVVATDFVKAMNHELRTPLNVIIGLCQFLERDHKSQLSPIQRDAVNRMERNARSLLQTVNHLLACLKSGRFD